MKIYLFVLFGALLAGCCCVSSDLAESGISPGLSCRTYSQSCDKSCAALAPGDPTCVQDCGDMLAQEGIDPYGCCPEEHTMGWMCDFNCNAEYTTGIDYSTCMEYCEEGIGDAGLGPDDCIVPT